MKLRAIAWLCAALLAAGITAGAQEKAPAWECVDLNDTVAFGESSVWSMAELPDGRVLVGCGGGAAHLLLFDPHERTARVLRSWDRPGCVRDLLVRGQRFWMVVGGEPATIVPDDARLEDEHLFSGSLEGERESRAWRRMPRVGACSASRGQRPCCSATTLPRVRSRSWASSARGSRSSTRSPGGLRRSASRACPAPSSWRRPERSTGRPAARCSGGRRPRRTLAPGGRCGPEACGPLRAPANGRARRV